MKIALVFPPFHHPDLYNLPPLGLISLATVLQGQGHEVTILDQVLAILEKTVAAGPGIYDDCARQIAAEGPEVVAFGAQCTTYPPVVQIAARLRSLLPRVKIVIGGHNASFVDTATLEFCPTVDAVVRGEGELTLPALISAWACGRSASGVAGVTWRDGCQIRRNPDRDLVADLNTLPTPDYRLAPPLETYRQACDLPRAIAILEVGRGCPHRCVYCSESALWRRRTRTYAVERVVGEMQQLHRDHGAECFLLAYDQFTADRSYVESFCRQILDARLGHLSWYCISRLDTVDAPLLGLMREAGCESLCYGVDSGSPRTLAFIRKKIDPGILEARVAQTTATGIVPTLSFIIGLPEETEEDLDATLELALTTSIQGNCNPLIQLPTVLPGTELYQRYGNSLTRTADTYFALGLEFDQGRRLAGDEALIESSPELFSSFHNLPCPGLPLDYLAQVASAFPLVVKLFPKTFLLLSKALGAPVSTLFRSFLKDFAAGRTPAPELTAANCYSHLPSFVEELLSDISKTRWGHLQEVLAYERRAIEVARFAHLEKAGIIDLNRLGAWRPRRGRNTLVTAFTFNLPAIIDDLKAGIVREDYPPGPTWLIFHQQADTLEVTEINEFGRDFIDLCDGDRSVEEIARRLYPRFAGELDAEGFLQGCREAAGSLTEMKLIHPG